MSDDWDRWGDGYLQGAWVRHGVNGLPISNKLKDLLNKWKKERGYDSIKNPTARHHNNRKTKGVLSAD
tara:strand:- start:1040 stop:1243 length:204 start_codon:yes stop_codon:yes gene_type:complete